MRNKHILKTLSASAGLITLFTMLGIGAAAADSLSWTGGVDTDWTRNDNWLNAGGPPHAPQAGDTVDIDTPAAAIIYNNLATPVPAIADLTVGDSATGNLTINNALTSTTANLAVGSTANGTVTVSGALGRWNNGDLTVGVAGIGLLEITAAGGYSGSGAAVIAADAGSSGSISVSGGGSYFQTTGPFVIGDAGAGAFEVVTGATATANDTIVAQAGGATGTVNIAGGGSTWTTGDLTVGDGGLGTMTVSTGATAAAATTIIGNLAGSAGSTIGLSGNGSAFDISGQLVIGKAGGAGFTVFSGATATSGSAVIGSHADGTASVGGLGSLWTTGSLLIGGNSADLSSTASGNGTLDISAAGAVDSTSATLGDTTGASGTVTVDGGGSHWNVANTVTVGDSGSGLVKVTNAGAIASDGAILGADAGGIGTVLVTGSGSAWRDSGNLTIGAAGSGALQVTLGGAISAADTTIAAAAGSTGSAIVSGDGSVFDTTGALTVGSSGNGTLTVADGGAISAGSVTLAALAGSTGTLTIGAALGETAAGIATLETGAIHFGAGSGTLVFNFGGPAYTLTASVDGNGAIDIAGGSVDIAGNASGFTGTTTVSGGSLTVDGMLGGALVLTGGTLTGTGTIGAASFAAGATASPGGASSIGTLTVAGNISFAAGAAYAADVGATTSDRIHATGTATLSGGTVIAVGQGSGFSALQTYTILTADGGVTGRFDGVTSSYAFLTPELGYDADDVTLTLERNDVSFASVGNTRNERAAASGIDNSVGVGTLYTSLLTLDTDQARDAFGQLAGDLHASIAAITFDNSRFVRNVGIDRLRSAFGGVGAAGGTVFVLDSPAVGLTSSALGYGETKSASPAALATAAILADPHSAPAVGWAQAYGGWGETDGDGNAAGIRDSTGGVVFGADAPLRETSWRLGVMGGYSHGNFDQTGGSASADSDNYDIGLYGGNQWGPLALRLGALYEKQSISTRRSVDYPGFSEDLKADYDAATAQVYGELGYRIDAGKIAFEPFANLAYVHQHNDAFQESGGVAALDSAAGNAGVTFTTVGLRAATDFTLAGIAATTRGSLGWRHAFGDTQTASSFHFSGGDDFTTFGIALDKDSMVLDAGVDFATGRASSIGLTYSGQYGSSSLSQTVKADLAVRF